MPLWSIDKINPTLERVGCISDQIKALAVALVPGLTAVSTVAVAQDGRHHSGPRGGHESRGHDGGHYDRGGHNNWAYRGGYDWRYDGSWRADRARARWLCEARGICSDWYGYYAPPVRYYDPGLSFGLSIR